MPIKVGVFDSGVGGITVLSELRRRFQSLDFVYLGDTANVPYGPKSPTHIQSLSAECAKMLRAKDVNAVVVACNTASSWALPAIEKVLDGVPVIGVVEPGVDAAMSAWKELKKQGNEGPILVLATKATVQSHAYSKSLKAQFAALGEKKSNSLIIEQACPLLVPMIEEGWIDHPILHQTLLEYLKPYKERYTSGVALLGCTHYPWIHSAFEKALPGWIVVNSARAIAEKLQQQKYFKRNPISGKKTGKMEWIFTDPESVPSFAKKEMGWSEEK